MTRFSVQFYVAAPGGPVNWRLLSANNRECGRGDGGFDDVDQCRDFVTALQQQLPRVRHRSRRVDAYRWAWTLDLDDANVAGSGRSFDRLVRCEQGARIFVTELAGASIRDGLVVSGARRFGSVA